jgi:hypothetical protein
MHSKCVLVLMWFILGPMCWADSLVPFVIPAQIDPNSAIALSPAAPIGVSDKRLVIRDG